jgi:hypothetical protein
MKEPLKMSVKNGEKQLFYRKPIIGSKLSLENFFAIFSFNKFFGLIKSGKSKSSQDRRNVM